MRIAPIFSYNFEKKNVQRQPVHKSYASDVFVRSGAIAQPAFTAKTFEDLVVKSVEGTAYWGKGLYNTSNFVDYSKCGSDNLYKIPFDITKATDNEIYAFQFANALAEVKDISWVQRFNPYNVTKPLATFHTLGSKESRMRFAHNIEDLRNTSKNKSLDVPITGKNGKLAINCIVFDTETTGINNSDISKPLDRIIQIGAIQVKNGNVVKGSGVNQLIDPKMPIPDAASQVHGIYDKDVQGKPEINKFLKPFMNEYMKKENGVIVAYNSKFDMGMLRNAVLSYNVTKNDQAALKPHRDSKVLDPFILIQRIHPYVGAKKKLGEQYKFLFGKNLEGAHDAFADVEGTVDVLKYCLYFLNGKRKNHSKPLTMREVLLFQNGFVPDNLDIKLDHEGCRADVNFEVSYKPTPIPMNNFYKGYRLTEQTLEGLKDKIGEANVNRFGKLFPCDAEDKDEGVVLKQKRSKDLINYALRKNFMKTLDYLGLRQYNGKSAAEIKNLIIDESVNYLPEKAFSLWIKNVNPNDEGNDLPDYKISKRVMKEKLAGKNQD